MASESLVKSMLIVVFFAYSTMASTVVISHIIVTTIPSKLAIGVDSLTVLPDGPITLSVNTFKDASYQRLLALDLSSCGLHAIPNAIFSTLTSLRRLSLANNSLTYDSMTAATFQGLQRHLDVLQLHSQTVTSVAYPGSALAPLVKLERLLIAALPDIAFPDEFGKLTALKTLRLVGDNCHAAGVNNLTFEAFRNCSHVVELTVRACDVHSMNYDSLQVFTGRLTTLNFACNPKLGIPEIRGAIAHSDLLKTLDTLIIDDVNTASGHHSFHPTMFERAGNQPSPHLRRLSYRANGVDLMSLNLIGRYLPSLRRFNIGFNKLNVTLATLTPPGWVSKISDYSANLTLEVIDAGSLFESSAVYRKRYCRSTGPYNPDAYFPSAPRLASVNYTRAADPHATEVLDTLPYSAIPRSVQTLLMDNYHNSPNHMYRLGPHRLHAHNRLVVWNVSRSVIRKVIGPFENFDRLQVFTLAHSQINDIGKHALDGLSSLLYLYLNDNILPTLPCTAFNGLRHLLHLDLSANKLSSLPADLFAQQMALRTLLLSGNRLLAVNFFLNAPKLQLVDLSANPLRTASAEITHHAGTTYTRRRLFRFDGVSTFVCDCRSLAFSAWWSLLHDSPGAEHPAEVLRCSNARHRRLNTSVVQFGREGLAHCEHDPVRHRAAIGLLSAAIVASAIAAIVWTVLHLRKVRSNNASTSAARYRQFRNTDDVSFR